MYYNCFRLYRFASCEFEPFANQLDNSCLYLGCTDNTAANWNSQANIDDGFCVAAIIGCTDNGLLENALGQVMIQMVMVLHL